MSHKKPALLKYGARIDKVRSAHCTSYDPLDYIALNGPKPVPDQNNEFEEQKYPSTSVIAAYSKMSHKVNSDVLSIDVGDTHTNIPNAKINICRHGKIF